MIMPQHDHISSFIQTYTSKTVRKTIVWLRLSFDEKNTPTEIPIQHDYFYLQIQEIPKTMKKIFTTLSVLLMAAAAMAQVPSYVPTNGLVGYWPFNGNANDESGNGRNGQVTDATLTADQFGNSSSAYNFDYTGYSNGSLDDMIYVPHDNGLNSQQLSVSCWFKPTAWSYPGNPGSSAVFKRTENGYDNPPGEFWYIVFNDDGKLVAGLISDSQGNSPVESPTGAITLGNWCHAVLTYDGGVEKLYLNGNLIDQVSGSNLLSTQGTSGLSFGVSYQANGYWRPFNGDIDESAVWNRALTEQEITDLYNSNSCPNPITATITPNGNTTFCAGGFVQLTASTGDSYLWSNGETTQTITATQAGQYTVTVTNNDGCSDVSDPVTVTVNPTPNSGVTVGGATTFCSGGSVTLTSQASSGSYLWSNGETTQSITVNQTGNYSVTVTENGCSATSGSTAVTVNQTPTATITPQGNTTFCQGGFVVLQASGGGTYQWNTGSQSSSINVSQDGTYSVIVTDNGCTDQTSQTVTVNPLPNVTLASINDVCENATAVSLTGGMPMGGSYTVNGTPSTELNPSVTGSGTQTVAYEYTDNNGCTNTATQTVTVNATPNVTLSGLNTSYTPTDSPSTLSGSPTGGVFNGSGVSNGMFDPAVAGLGTHGIMYTVVDGNGCVGGQALCTTVDINVNVGGGNIDTDGGTIDVYPNPSNGLFSISVDGIDGIINMVIYDSRGREIINE